VISSLILTLLILGSLVSVSLPFSSAGNSQSILFGTIILEIIDVDVSQNTTHAGAVIDVVTTVNASWDVFDFSAFHVETYYDSQLIDSRVFYVLETGQGIFSFTSVWNTTGVEPGLYAISAIAYGSNIDAYVDGSVQILPPPRTWIVDDDGPADFSTIQEAINAADDGDTVFVRNGTYYEHIVINKTISLIGENPEDTIIDAEHIGTVVLISGANYVTISGFAIRNSGVEYYAGIYLSQLNHCCIIRNDIADNLVGILLYGSSNNKIAENNLKRNSGNGISLTSSSNNTIVHNNIVNNTNQVYIYESTDNRWDDDYPSGGNYWSDYNGSDLYLGPAQDQLGTDEIGDTPYYIDENNTDHYPLMNPWTPPDAAALNILSSKTIVGEGFSTNVTVFLENQGSKIEELNSTFHANETFIGYQTFMLRSNNSIIYSSEWDLASLAKGNYSLSVRIFSLEGETDLNDNSLSGNWVFISIPGDLNGDKTVDIYDAILLVGCFNAVPYSPHWNPNRDINNDGIIDLFDALILAANYGKSWT